MDLSAFLRISRLEFRGPFNFTAISLHPELVHRTKDNTFELLPEANMRVARHRTAISQPPILSARYVQFFVGSESMVGVPFFGTWKVQGTPLLSTNDCRLLKKFGTSCDHIYVTFPNCGRCFFRLLDSCPPNVSYNQAMDQLPLQCGPGCSSFKKIHKKLKRLKRWHEHEIIIDEAYN